MTTPSERKVNTEEDEREKKLLIVVKLFYYIMTIYIDFSQEIWNHLYCGPNKSDNKKHPVLGFQT
jgi:hypothetical protein